MARRKLVILGGCGLLVGVVAVRRLANQGKEAISVAGLNPTHY